MPRNRLSETARFQNQALPWAAPQAWREANQSLSLLVRRGGPGLAAARRQAQRLARVREKLHPLLDRLCALTCPRCLDVCCHRARVHLDFEDLLFLHLVGRAAPPTPRPRPSGGPCQSRVPAGCLLARMVRPWVCAWYLCHEQKQLLQGVLRHERVEFETAAAAVKRLRRDMLESFIAAVG